MKQDHPDLSVRRQCSLLSLARSGLYYQPRGESAEIVAFMAIIDRQFLETPWYGSRQMARHMQREGHRCGRHRVRRLMKLMRVRRENGPPDRFLNVLTTDLSGAQDQHEASRAQDLPISDQEPVHHPPQPGQVAPTSATYPCAGDVFPWWPSWIGTAARCSAGG